MSTTTTDVTTLAPISRPEAPALAEEEYRRFAALLATVEGEQWERPTDCARWRVRDLAGHVVGAMRAAASVRETLSQQREVARRVKAHGGSDVDHMTAVQVERVAGLDHQTLVAECRRLVGAAAAGRRRAPWPVRQVRIPQEVNGRTERWRLGYLFDTILTRDTWMHRVDLARALDVVPELDAAHDGRIVADVVAEWARRHGQPFTLVLAGPAGGAFTQGAGGPDLELDAVEFCRTLSGRAEGEGLLATQVPF